MLTDYIALEKVWNIGYFYRSQNSEIHGAIVTNSTCTQVAECGAPWERSFSQRLNVCVYPAE